ncbi:hypothetical protein [Haploplasma axanthum]|uniref:Uncharacterized protein n=1 Tax=Haploplasma axanthum TaxID=29552 RepID=A0A449BC16_HAPAX|nr:hypothetical protein [Haploplasma axanthum]VEU79976.1 Uncharacterised protein [Haploplasma axanthum]
MKRRSYVALFIITVFVLVGCKKQEISMYANGKEFDKSFESNENVELTWSFKGEVKINNEIIESGYTLTKDGEYELVYGNKNIEKTVNITINKEKTKLFLNGKEINNEYLSNEEIRVSWVGIMEYVKLDGVDINQNYLIENDGEYQLEYKDSTIKTIKVIKNSEDILISINGSVTNDNSQTKDDVTITWTFLGEVQVNGVQIEKGHVLNENGEYKITYGNGKIKKNIIIVINKEEPKILINGKTVSEEYLTNEEVRISWTGIIKYIKINDEIIEQNHLITTDGEYIIKYYIDEEKELLINKNSVQPEISFFDINGNIIEDIENNNMTFTINTNPNVNISVNGENIFVNQRFYDIGKYNVVVEDKFGNSNLKSIFINDLYEKSNYNMVYTYATLPTLYATLDIVKNDHPGFMWYGRTGTISESELRNSNQNIVFSGHTGDPASLKNKAIRSEGHEYIKNVLKEDKNAFFNLYVDDFRHWVEFALFDEIGIGSNRYEVIYISDGTYTYTKKYSFMQGSNDYNTFLNLIKDRRELSENLKSNILNISESGDYLGETIDHYDDYILIGTMNSNIHYWMQYPEFMPKLDSNISNNMKYANIEEVLPENLYSKLDSAEKEIFLKIIGLDKAVFDEEYFSDTTKKYLVITGTNPPDGKLGEANFINMLDQVIELYSDEYNFVFKPHPSGIPTTIYYPSVYDKLVQENIKILPGRLPMEVLTWVYPEFALGGFNSSLYMSAPKGNTLFFFTINETTLISPIKELYSLLFSNAVFIQPKP